jgi:hypothetical protein
MNFNVVTRAQQFSSLKETMTCELGEFLQRIVKMPDDDLEYLALHAMPVLCDKSVLARTPSYLDLAKTSF